MRVVSNTNSGCASRQFGRPSWANNATVSLSFVTHARNGRVVSAGSMRPCIAMPQVVTGWKLCISIMYVRSALLCILESGDEIFVELGLDRSRDEKQAKVPLAPVLHG